MANVVFPLSRSAAAQPVAGTSGSRGSREPLGPQAKKALLDAEWEEVDLLAGVKTPPLPSEAEAEGGAVGGAETAAESQTESSWTSTCSSSTWTADEAEGRSFRRHWRDPFSCCGESFPTEEALLAHEGRMVNKYRAMCLEDECGDWFRCGRALQRHQYAKGHKGVAFHHEGRLVLGEIPSVPLLTTKEEW